MQLFCIIAKGSMVRIVHLLSLGAGQGRTGGCLELTRVRFALAPRPAGLLPGGQPLLCGHLSSCWQMCRTCLYLTRVPARREE